MKEIKVYLGASQNLEKRRGARGVSSRTPLPKVSQLPEIWDGPVYFQSEIGLLEIFGTEESLLSVNFVADEAASQIVGRALDEASDEIDNETTIPGAVAACISQLEEYFRGERQIFSLKLEPEGTAFQKAVWRQLTTIPYGQTVSYLDVAKMIGNAPAVRAVGAANGRNPIAIVIPCHRVVGSDGRLTGYGGGLWRKEWLLNHERKFSSGQMALF